MNYQKLMVVTAMALAFSGCEAGAFVGPGSEIPVNVRASVADLVVSGVTVEVTGSGIAHPIVANLSISGDVASGSIQVLAGSARTFTMRAFDAQGVETHQGERTSDIQGNTAPTIQVSMTPLVGSVDVDGRVGSYTVSVSPGTSTVSPGGAVQLTASVLDAFGDPVTGGVVWGSSNPSIASVDATGRVTGHVPGTVSVVANHKGFAGSATVTVQ